MAYFTFPTPTQLKNGLAPTANTDFATKGYVDNVVANGGAVPTVQPYTDNFVGDGTTSTLNLSVSPLNKNYTTIVIDGVTQLRSTYSLSGAVITLGGAPVSGAKIQVTTDITGTAGAFQSISSGTSSVGIPAANGNVVLSAGGNVGITVTSSGTTLSGNTVITNVSNLSIGGGSNGQVLSTNGSGTLSWKDGGSSNISSISNGTSNVVIATANGNVDFTVNGNSTFTVTDTGVVFQSGAGGFGWNNETTSWAAVTNSITPMTAMLGTTNGFVVSVENDDLYLYPGDNKLFTSPDGITWTAAGNIGLSYPYGIVSSISYDGTDYVFTIGTNFYQNYGVALDVYYGSNLNSLSTVDVGFSGYNTLRTNGIYDGTNFVLVGSLYNYDYGTIGTQIRTATDPAGTWTSSNISTLWGTSVAGNSTASQWVIVGTANTNNPTTTALYSSDLTTWRTATLPVSAQWNAVTYGNGIFVATADSTIAFSSDGGATWSAVNEPSGITQNSNSPAVWNGSSWVFAGRYANYDGVTYSTTSLVSGSGTTWATANTLNAAQFGLMTYSSSAGILAVDNGGHNTQVGSAAPAQYSFGVNSNAEFNSAATFTSNVSLGSVGNVHITGGTSGQVLRTDGAGNLSWVPFSSTSINNGTSNVSIGTANGNIAFNVGGNSNILTVTSNSVVVGSTGGTSTFTFSQGANSLSPIPFFADQYCALGVGNGVFLAGTSDATRATANGPAGKISYSTNNGNSWTTTNGANLFNIPSSFAFGNGTYVVVLGGALHPSSNPTSNVASSTDGISWTTSAAMPNSAVWSNVIYANGQFVAVSDGVNVATSTNGTTWTRRTAPSSGGYTSVAFGNNRYVAVSTSTAGAYSTDNGSTWSSTTLPSTTNGYYGVVYAFNKFYIFSDRSNAYSTSTDGITWTTATLSDTSQFVGVPFTANTNGPIIVVGENAGGNPVYLYTTDGTTWSNTTRNFSDTIWFNGSVGQGANYVSISTGTSVDIGTLSGPPVTNLSVTGAFIANGGANLGNVSNVTITGGSSGQFLQTNGSGTLSWGSVPSAKYSITNVNTATYQMLVTDQLVTVAYNGATTIRLPAASSNTIGQVFNIKDTLGNNRTGNAITIAPSGSDTLDGGNVTISNPYNNWTIVGITSTSWGVI